MRIHVVYLPDLFQERYNQVLPELQPRAQGLECECLPLSLFVIVLGGGEEVEVVAQSSDCLSRQHRRA